MMTGRYYSVYTDTISEADWTRFEFYSQKVRTIRTYALTETIEAGSMIQLLNSRPPSIRYLLPRVAEIDWELTDEPRSLPQLVPLLSPTLKSFTLHSDSGSMSEDIDTIVVLRHLAFLPGLKLLKLGANWLESTPDLDPAICDILDSQKETLMSFSHQTFDLNERFSASISRLRSLVRLDLDFSGTHNQTNQNFNNFSATLASRCPILQFVRLRNMFGAQGRTFYAFLPLTGIKEMKSIQIHCVDLALELQDLQEMGASWRSLKELRFPFSSILLPWLATIARHFSSALEVIEAIIPVPKDFDPDYTTFTPFTSVKHISCLYYVQPESAKAVGSFIQRLVAPGTAVGASYGAVRRLTEAVGSGVSWWGEWESEKEEEEEPVEESGEESVEEEEGEEDEEEDEELTSDGSLVF
ncbi:hypothetical protein FRC01_001002 [Tulasnella sp. 417]|nr:hypothetical protein FRC01_001002 [Tulasnella sp. 417]